MAKSSTSKKPAKPQKPYPGFPLTPHPSGRWCKKIRGKLHYFGPWDDWQAALARYNEQKDDLYAGREPRQAGATLADLVNAFLAPKQQQLDDGALRQLLGWFPRVI